MDWKKYTIKTTTEAEDFISAMLMEVGIEGMEIEDNVPISEEDMKKLYIDILPVLPIDDGVAYVSFYLEEDKNEEDYLPQVKEGLEELRMFVDIGEGTITKTISKVEEWRDKWKEFFKPFTIDDIVIKPTWEDISEEDKEKMVIEIDPGTAFGTGKHETTQLVIRQMKKYVDENTDLLDLGCGSGILSIIGCKLGAKSVQGTDIDVLAVEASNDNMKVNGIEENKYRFHLGNIIDDENLQTEVGLEKYDVAVANILADIIIPMTPIVPKLIKKGGIFISSGIIFNKEEAVKEAILKTGMEIIEITHQGDWVSITAKR